MQELCEKSPKFCKKVLSLFSRCSVGGMRQGIREGNLKNRTQTDKLYDFVRHLLNHRAEHLWGDAVEALAVGHNAYAAHLHGARREENTLVLWSKKTLRTGFAAEEDDCVKRPPTAVRC